MALIDQLRTRLMPASRYQSLTNPTQGSRLPPSGGVQIAFPIFTTDREGREESLKRYASQLVVWALLPLGYLIALEMLGRNMAGFAGTPLAAHLAIGIASGLFLHALRGWTGWAGRLWSLLLSIVVTAVLALDPTGSLATLGGVALLLWFADRLATQTLGFDTLPPVLSHVRDRRRRSWRERFRRPLANPGAEWYPLGLATAALCLLVLTAAGAGPDWGGAGAVLGLPLLAAIVAAAAIVLMLLSEWSAAALSGRSAIGLRIILRHVRRSVRQWCTYNWEHRVMIGTYRAPAGDCLSRRRQLLAAALLGVGLAGIALQTTHDTPVTGLAEEVAELSDTQRQMFARLSEPEAAAWKAKFEERGTTIRATQRPRRPGEGLGAAVFVAGPVCALVGVAITSVPILLALGGLAGQAPPPTGPGRFLNPNLWNDTVEAMRTSPDPVERDSVFCGVNAVDTLRSSSPARSSRSTRTSSAAPGPARRPWD